MITPEHEYFLRFILLILQGGASLLRCIANKALQKKGMSLKQFLNTVEYKVRSSKLSIKQKSILFPGSSEGPCIEDFDITLLSYLIINYLKGELEGNELNAVEHIRDIRNNYQAHAAEAKMDSKIFTKEWSKLVRFIITIGTKMSEAEQKKLNDTIDNIENDQLDIKCVIEEIKRLDESDAFFEKIQNCLEDIRGWQEELYSEVSDVLEVTQQTSDAVSKIEQITEHTASEVSKIDTDTQQTASAVGTINSTTQQMASAVRKIDDNVQQTFTISGIIHKTTQETYATTSNIQENIQQTSADVRNILETAQLALGAVCSANETTQETHANMKDVQANMKDVQEHTKRMSSELVNVHKAVLEVLDMRVDLLKLKEQQENQGKNTKIVNTVFGRVKISADDQKTVDNAEAVLLKATIDCLTKSSPTESHREVKEKMDQFLGDIRKFDVEVQNVRTGSIVIEFRCKSLSGVLALIDYFYSPCCQKRLDEVAKVLEDLLCKKICVRANIDSQSIRDIITKTDKKEHQKTVQFDISCTGIDGLIHTMDMFEDGKAANSLNELSKALSDAVGKPVTLHTSIDMNQMGRAIQNIRESLGTEMKEELMYSYPVGTEVGSTELNIVDRESSPPAKKVKLLIETTRETDIQTEEFVRGTEINEELMYSYPVGTEVGSTELNIVDRESSPPAKKAKLLIETTREIEFQTQEIVKDNPEPAVSKHNSPSSPTPAFDHGAGCSFMSSFILQHGAVPHPHAQEHMSLTLRHTINVKTDLDKKKCSYTGCVVLRPNIVLLVDKTNEKLKVIDTEHETVVDEKNLHSQPWDVALLPEDQICVTFPNKEEIAILNTAAEMSVVRTVQINRKCWGVTYNNACIYIVCWEPSVVLVMDLQGNIQREVLLNSEQFEYPRYIDISKDLNHFYISDFNSNYVARITFQGDLEPVYKHKKLDYAQGLVVIEDGSLLVCCWSGIVCHVSADLRELYSVIKDVPKARSICYQSETRQVYVAGDPCDYITVFTLQNTVTVK